ncbi:ABC-type glycerol-3-phosphate transport system, substrate-binding protein [Halogeometricum rufum]|uniref:ABC-type glycerol-3-phosphate transport system, substrate-binding protein n=1 Tax=Halogeometricum rufum TaxID=553469 RepID=A0A1I6IGQ7_9EURY|nr:ABC-type glycerol-3-phosphate transport system, substrate-binding protein [Halogeometricum rufum]
MPNNGNSEATGYSSNSTNATLGISRRRALKSLGVAGVAGLAGCAGGNGGSGNGGTTDASGGGGTATTGGSEKNANGTTITLWTTLHGQSKVAEQFLDETIKAYEQRTGNSVQWIKETVSNVQNGNWRQRMAQGQIPTLYQTAPSRIGGLIDAGYVTPWGSVLDQLSDDVVSGTEWAQPVVENIYRGFEDNKLKTALLGFVMQEPFVARADHFEEAGLDIETDFPPKNYDELIDIAKTLQKDGPGDIGFQVHGAPGDLMDEISPTWAHAIGGEQGLYVNADWSDTHLDSDAWKTSLRRQVEIYREMGLSAENSATTSDEDACRFLADGRASMSQVGMLNYGLLSNLAPDMLENGTLRYGASWKGESGFRGEFNATALALGSKPPNVSSAKWERQRQAGIEFIDTMLSTEVQKKAFTKWGLLPFNRNAWEESPTLKNNAVEAGIAIAEESEYGWQAFPEMAAVQYNISGPIFQQAMTGELSPEEACNQAASQIRQQVFSR